MNDSEIISELNSLFLASPLLGLAFHFQLIFYGQNCTETIFKAQQLFHGVKCKGQK